MSLYGILKDALVNTGQDSELLCVFAAPLTIKSNAPSFSGDSMNLKRNVRRQSPQRWEVSANIKPQSGAGDLPAFLLSKGDSEIIGIRMPQVAMMTYDTADIKLNIGVEKGDSSISIKNAVVEGPLPTLAIGEFVRIQGGVKVYLVVADLGTGVYQIHPPCLAMATADTILHHGGSVTMAARIDKDNASNIKFTDGILMDPGTITFVEQL
jgi:hypothetical protein